MHPLFSGRVPTDGSDPVIRDPDAFRPSLWHEIRLDSTMAPFVNCEWLQGVMSKPRTGASGVNFSGALRRQCRKEAIDAARRMIAGNISYWTAGVRRPIDSCRKFRMRPNLSADELERARAAVANRPGIVDAQLSTRLFEVDPRRDFEFSVKCPIPLEFETDQEHVLVWMGCAHNEEGERSLKWGAAETALWLDRLDFFSDLTDLRVERILVNPITGELKRLEPTFTTFDNAKSRAQSMCDIDTIRYWYAQLGRAFILSCINNDAS